MREKFVPDIDLESLTLSGMREDLANDGWEYSVSEYGVPKFSRTYARINSVLEGEDWRELVVQLPQVLHEVAPELGALSVGMEGEITGVTISFLQDENDETGVKKVFIANQFFKSVGFEEIDEDAFANWLAMKDKLEEPNVGTKEFFETNPRSARIRELSLSLIDEYAAVVGDQGIEGDAIDRLIGFNHELAEMGVEPGMQTGRPKIDYLSDPVITAEWAAGQIRSLIASGEGLSGGALALIQEHDLFSGDLPVAIISSDAPDIVKRMSILLLTLESLRENLGPDDQF